MKPLSKEEIDRCYAKWGCVPLDSEWVRSSSHFISDGEDGSISYIRTVQPFKIRRDWSMPVGEFNDQVAIISSIPLPQEWIDKIKLESDAPYKGFILTPSGFGHGFIPQVEFYVKNQTHTNNKTMQEQILSEVSEILVENYGLRYDEITPEATLNENLDLDSLDRVEFLSEIEDKFNIRAQDDDLETLKTVQDVITYIDDRINAHRPQS